MMSNCHIHCLTVTFNSVVDIVIYFSSICSSDKIPARMSDISGPTLDTFWPLPQVSWHGQRQRCAARWVVSTSDLVCDSLFVVQ